MGTLRLKGSTSGYIELTAPASGPNTTINTGLLVYKDSANGTITGTSTNDISEGTNLYYTTARADSDIADYLTGDITTGNITTTGYLRGPATFTIDPAVHGDSTGLVTILGNLQVEGATTTINSTTLTVNDKNIVLADSAANAAAADGAGITVAGANATLTYNSTPDAWSFNKNVGIGTTNPAGTLHLSTASDTYLYMGTTNATADARIQFRNSAGTDAGGLWYATNGNNMLFRTNSAERMRITSGGYLLVGTTQHRPATNNVNGVSIDATYGIEASVTSGGPLTLNRKSTDGGILSLKKDGSTIGYLGSNAASGTPVLDISANSSSGIMRMLTSGTERMRIDASGHVNIGVVQTTTYGTANRPELQIVGVQEAIITLDNTSGGVATGPVYINNNQGILDIFNTNNSYMRFGTNSAERMRIDAAGDVYIGNNGSAATRVVEISGTNTGTNPAANGHIAGELRLRNVSATDNNHSAISWYNSNNAVDSRITGVHKSHSSRYGELAFLTHDGSSLGERMRISSTGFLGINDSAPLTPLHIRQSNRLGSTFTGSTRGEGITVEQTNYTNGNYVSLIEAPYDNGGVPTARIGVKFSGSGSELTFGTSNNYSTGVTNVALVINPNGDLGLGNTPATVSAYRTLELGQSSGSKRGRLNFKTNSGDVTLFSFERSSYPYLGVYTTDGSTYIASFDRDGLKFGSDTAAANALDDYEEGTWTPTTPNGSWTVNEATYTKIGRLVFCRARVTATSAITSADFGGLPYTVLNSYSAGVVGYQNSVSGEVFSVLVQAANKFNFRIGQTQYGLNNGAQAMFSFTYETSQ